MTDLAEFVLARIAEDEAVAREASHQKIAGPFHGHWIAGSAMLMANGALDRSDREHIARHDPARVLAECEAKRRIVAAIDDQREYTYAKDWDRLQTDRHLDEVLRLLALPYADHPDFREEWRA